MASEAQWVQLVKGAEKSEKKLCLQSEWFVWGLIMAYYRTIYYRSQKIRKLNHTNTIIVHTNSTHYYYCTPNSSSDSWSGERRLALPLFYILKYLLHTSYTNVTHSCHKAPCSGKLSPKGTASFLLLPLVHKTCNTLLHVTFLPGRIPKPGKNHIGPFCIVLVYFSRIQ